MAVLQAHVQYLLMSHLVIGLTVGAAAHGHLFPVRGDEPVPKAIQICDFIMVELRHWAASQRVECFSAGPTLDALIAAKDLGPGFLDDEDPDLVLLVITCLRWLGEGPSLRLLIVREVVIDDHDSFFTIDIHLHGVAASFVDLMSAKYALDALGVLCERAQTGEKVAISAASLLDIVGARVVIEHKVVLPIDFFRPFPGEILPSLMPPFFLNV